MKQKIINFLILAYSFTIVFENFEGFSIGSNSIPKMLSIFLIIGVVPEIKLAHKKELIRLGFVLFTLLILLFSVSFLNDDFSVNWLPKMVVYLLNFSFFWIISLYLSDHPELTQKIPFFFSLGVFLTVLIFFSGIGVRKEFGRLIIFGENANTIGLNCNFTILFVLTRFFSKQNLSTFRKYLELVLTFPLIYVVALTGSRTSFIALIFCGTLFFFFRQFEPSVKSMILRFLGPIFVALIANLMLSVGPLADRLNSTIDDGDLSGRDKIWSHTVPAVTDQNPFFGVGISGYTVISSEIHGNFFSPHNVFIELYSYSGIIGLTLFFVFFFRKILLIAWRLIRHYEFPFPFLVMFLILLIFSTGQGLSNKLFWLFYAYTIAMGYYFTNIEEEIDEEFDNIENLTTTGENTIGN
jgi:O-antigen ligase